MHRSCGLAVTRALHIKLLSSTADRLLQSSFSPLQLALSSSFINPCLVSFRFAWHKCPSETLPSVEMTKPVPLTTIFTPTASCLSSIFQEDERYAVLGSPNNPEVCFPSGWAVGSANYFSPGLCPSGYTAACSSLNTLPNTAIETVVTCCPT